ncbi:MAG: glycosyltransferase [Minisyncoccia bacterium]
MIAYSIAIVFATFIAFLGLTRFMLFMIGSSIYDIRYHARRKLTPHHELPTLSIIIPAYNEENTIKHCIQSVFDATYDISKRQIIVMNDGSKDRTEEIVRTQIATGLWPGVQLVTQTNAGKAHALNNGIKNYATGELIMCLDADSMLASDALVRAVSYFQVENVTALSANVRVRGDGSFWSIVQNYEYVIGWQMKRATTTFNIDYIIGGVGSTFRKTALEAVGYYDTDTIVEDMDLTLKIIRLGHKKHRIVFGADVICYTAGVLDFKGLLKQRYRWKYGHLQALIKHRDLFFSRDPRYSKQLTWIYLPYILFSETMLLVEPVFPALILFILYWFGDILSLFSGIAVITGSMVLHIAAERTMSLRERIKLIAAAPAMYFAAYTLTVIWYISLIRTYANIRSILNAKTSKWEPVERGKIAETSLVV